MTFKEAVDGRARVLRRAAWNTGRELFIGARGDAFRYLPDGMGIGFATLDVEDATASDWYIVAVAVTP